MASYSTANDIYCGSSEDSYENNVQITRATDYKKYEHKEHIYKVPDTYITSDQQNPREELLYNFDDKTIYFDTITLPSGVERLFIEGLTNSSDNVGRSRRNNVDPGIIEVTMDNHVITISNGGIPIPVEMHSEGVYTPELIFGTLLTSSNYEVDRHEAGRNGYGAKLINIFSHWFTVEVWDGFNKLHYFQKWEKNMDIRHDPVINPYTGKSKVKISFHLDFERFEYTEYPDEAYNLFYRHCIDISLNAMVEVRFNEEVINFSNIEDYARMIYGENMGKHFTHYEWPAGTEVTVKKNGLQIPKSSYVLPTARICVIDTPHNSFNISFVNSMMTRDGGDHVTAVVKAVSTVVIKSVNESGFNKNKDKKVPNITIKDVRPHLSIIILFMDKNPGWKSQAKTEYTHNRSEPPIKFNIDEKPLKSMLNWNMMDALFSAMEHKHINVLSKTDGKKKANIGPFNGTDSNWAGTNKSHECFLLVVEGSSAAGYANTFVTSLEARNTMGIFELRGKLLNVMRASKLKIAENKELAELKRVLGLVEGTDYSVEANFKRLRYGAVIFLTDADVDGEHIKGLGINYFHCRFPELLARGFAMWLATPIIKVTKGKQVVKFYTPLQYENWKKSTPQSGWSKPKYFKGLGTSTKVDVKVDAKDPKYVACIYDDRAKDYMELAFNNKLADERKKWIAQYQEYTHPDVPEEMELSSFINYDLIRFSIYDVRRSVPAWDGLKPSQRKILWASYEKWKWNIKRTKAYEEHKVLQFGGFVAEKTAYHHGEQNLYGTIISMAQDFVGSNNLPYFEPRGMFGSRNMGGKDAASPRYIFTVPQWWLPFVYRIEDFPIMKHVNDDGKDREPTVFLPIIPMSLVNGAQGIGTGWSTYIPPHNVLDIIGWYKDRIKGNKTIVIEPWFRGFKGDVTVIDKNGKNSLPGGYYDDIDSYEDFEEMDTIDENYDKDVEVKKQPKMKKENRVKTIKVVNGKIVATSNRPRYSVVTTGSYKIVNRDTVIITELPIKVWTKNYDMWLDKLTISSVEDPKTKKKTKMLASKVRDEKDDNEIYFKLTGFEKPGYKELKLRRSFALTNMVLLEEDGTPVKYDNVLDILESFYQKRLPYYTIRRDNMIDETTKYLQLLSDKIAFILAIVEKRLKIRNVPKKTVIENMIKLELNVDLYGTAKLSNINKDEVDELMKEKEIKQKHLDWLNKITPAELWSIDLADFETEYLKHYAD